MKPPSHPSPRRGARTLALAGCAALALALASCSITRPAPVKRTYLLEPAAPAAAASPRPVALRMGSVNVGAPYRGKAFVYRQDEIKFEADFYNEFFVAPAAMLSEATARALAASGAFRRVIPPGGADDGDYVLDGFAADLYGDARDPAKPAAVLAITYYLSPANALTPNVIWSKEYRQRVPMAEPSAEALARAWNAALAAIVADLARDLAAANLK
jgi:cholesterol transport system auxiliary component